MLGSGIAVASCDAPKLQTFLQDAGTSFQVTQTFGELSSLGPTQVAHYLEVQLTPATTPVFVPTSGEIVFANSFDGLTNCVIIKPKLRDKDKATPLEKLGPGLPEPKKLRVALCNLDNTGSPSPLNAAIEALYTQAEDPDPVDKTARFFNMTLEEKERRSNVWAAPEAVFPDPPSGGELKPWSRLGPAAAGKLQIVAFQAEDNGDLTYLNPAPFLAKIPLNPGPAVVQPSTIGEIRIETATDANFTAGLKSHTVNINTGVITPPDPLEGFARVFLRLNNPGPAPLVAPHEISYELRQAVSAVMRSHSRVFFNSLPTSSAVTLPTIGQATGELLYRTAGAAGTVSDPTTDTLWLQVLFDPVPLKPGGPPNYDIGSLTPANFIEVQATTSGGQRRYPAGDYELEIVLASGFGAAASDSKVVRFTLGGVSVEFVRDGPPANVVDASDPAIDFANIGHWGADSGTGLTGFDASNAILNGATAATNFVDQDPDRFYLRIGHPGANTNPATKQQITASIDTLDQSNAVDDDATNVRLDETGPDTGIFVSKAQLLTGPDLPFETFTDTNGDCVRNAGELFVDANGNGTYDTDNPDDDFAVHDGFTGTVCDDAANDRTHRAHVDGSVRATYSAGVTISSTISICQRTPEGRRVLNVALRSFNEPWQDVGFGPDPDGAGPLNPPGTGNNAFDWDDTTGPTVGVHDSGEVSEPFIDISNGAVVFARGNVGAGSQRGPIWADADVTTSMSYTRSLLASSCILLNESSRQTINPTGTLFAHFPGFFDDFPDDDGVTGTPTRDESLVQANFRSSATPSTQTTIDIYYVAPFTVAGGAYASQFRPGFVSTQGFAVDLINQVYIGLNARTDRVFIALAHELGHQIANTPDSATPNHINFPSGGAAVNDGTTPDRKRRIQHATETNYRTSRGASMTAVGNNLLVNP